MLGLGVIIALSTLATFSLTMADIDSYEVEKWNNIYNVKLLSENETKLGNITFDVLSKHCYYKRIVVFIGKDVYAAIITKNDASDEITVEFKQKGETIGWIDIVTDHNGNIVLKNVSPSLEQFESSFILVMKISKDPALIHKLKNPILIDGISGDEAFWCGAGAMGASRAISPAAGFFYACTCGLFAGMDSWSAFGGVSTGSGWSGARDPCSGSLCGYNVVRIWRNF